ncbi:right-handed parallel beta-helix repeat-containing protein [Phenylobacterium sp. LjRoot219]|uniref:right-handed parallel beta-helix repeat-containing protein n=1 Tax=Phenylobacterium sp. LjRoot219 TaxID=3342283 RepID=UPI003ECFDF63
MVKMVATGDIPNEKGILVTNGDVTVSNFEFSGAEVSSGNGAGIRYEDGNLVVNNSYFHDNQNGILANASDTGTVTITNSEFDHNGSGDGYTHNLYVNDVAKLTISDSYFHDAVQGHEIKSRASVTEISDSRIYDNDGDASYSVDLPNGGQATLTNNIIQQGANSANPNIVAYGAEGSLHDNSSLTMTGNTIVNEMEGRGAVVLNASNSEGTFEGNSVYGANEMISGSGVSESGTTTLASAPSLDTSQPWSATGSASAATDTDASADASATTGSDATTTDTDSSTDASTATDTSDTTTTDTSTDASGSTDTDSTTTTDTDTSTDTSDTSTDTTTEASTSTDVDGDATTDVSDATDTGASTDDGTTSDASCGGGRGGGHGGGHEYLTGLDGDDTVHFGGGQDTAAGGSGEDGVFEGAGHDRSGGVSNYAHTLSGGEHGYLGLGGLAGSQSDGAEVDTASTSDVSVSSAGYDDQHQGMQDWRHHSASDFLLG